MKCKSFLNKILLLICFLFATKNFSQKVSERFPVFPNCEQKNNLELENCFYTNLKNHIFNNFKVPSDLEKNNYKGSVYVLFEVSAEGNFKILSTESIYQDLITESQRVFKMLPKIEPPTYNGKPTYNKYTIEIKIPLQNPAVEAVSQTGQKPNFVQNRNTPLKELDTIIIKKFEDPIYKSHLNIPFSHQNYARFDEAINQMGSNNHTGSKPLSYSEMSRYFDMKDANDKLKKNNPEWWSRKLFDENLVAFQGKDYWFTLNPVFDLQVGKSNSSNVSKSTFINTRAVQFQGGLGSDVVFSTTVFESQGDFADYYNQYANSLKPSGGNPAIIPGIGIAKDFKTTKYDFPSAEANIKYTPSHFIDFQLGYGRNFIGDGYRSLLLGDGASPYPFFKINTTFWKIKYTNTYMFLKDVRPEVTTERTYATKYMSNHYLSLNVTNRLNIGLFESVIWTDTNNRGFDMNFLNPIIFYRSVEFSSSARTGNAVLGLTSKYKFNNQINFYGQFLLDEFSLGEVKSQNQSWKNKFGYQIGAKYYNAFNIKNLTLQLEYNRVRPYVYSHSDPLTNYGHNNQSMGHNWGANFQEFVAIARYRKDRFFGDLKIQYATRGFDFDTTTDALNYGSNIYKDYDINRASDTGVTVGQGNKTTIFMADLNAGYLLNPTTNLKVFGSFIYRNFVPTVDTATVYKDTTSWFSLGLRTDVFNFYTDY